MGGSKISLFHMLKCAPGSQKNYLVLASPIQKEYESLVSPYVEKIYYQEIPTWQKYNRRTLIEKLRAPLGDAYRILRSVPAAVKLSKIIREENIDLVHTNNSITPVGALAAYAAKVPHVWHIREPFGDQRQYQPILGDSIAFWLMKRLSKVIICNSEFTAKSFRDRRISHVIIQNGINLDYYPDSENRGKLLRASFGIKDDELVIGMVGNLTTEWKRHDYFLEIAAFLRREFEDINFIVFGSSSDLNQTEYTRKLAEQAVQMGIKDRLIWVDFIDDTGAMMNCLDILVHPALAEGSGRVIMEAMAVGRPLVAMRSGGVQELIQDGKTGFLIQPGNMEDFAKQVKVLLEDEGLRKEIGENARGYAQLHFSDQASMDAIVKVYEEIIQT